MWCSGWWLAAGVRGELRGDMGQGEEAMVGTCLCTHWVFCIARATAHILGVRPACRRRPLPVV